MSEKTMAKHTPGPEEFTRETREHLETLTLDAIVKRGRGYDVKDMAGCKSRLYEACNHIDTLLRQRDMLRDACKEIHAMLVPPHEAGSRPEICFLCAALAACKEQNNV